MINVDFFKKALFVMLSALLVSCVTVNVHFPEAAVQKAADDYVKELYKAKQEAEAEDKTGKSSSLYLLPGFKVAGIGLSVGLPQAEANPAFNVSSAKAKAIQAKQAKRLSKIDRFKKKGLIGEGENGLLVVVGKKMKKLESKRVNSLVSEENSDREALYSEVISANGIGSGQAAQVRKSFSQSFISSSPAGTPVQSGGSWTKK